MNNIWGSVAQHDVISWPWPIALYIFLAGLSAGSTIVAIIIKWGRPHDGKEIVIWDAMVKAGAIIAPVAIISGLLLLIVDLGKPLSFYWLLIQYNITSVMSLGVIVLLIYTPLSIFFMLMIFEQEITHNRLLKPLLSLIRTIKNFHIYSKIVESLLIILSIIVAAYTGFLLAVSLAIPLWNSAILPILFFTSSLSAGISASLLLGILLFKRNIHKDSMRYLLMLDFRVIAPELFLIFLLFIDLILEGGAAKEIAYKAMSTGGLAVLLWGGVIGLGLLTPVIISLTALKNHTIKLRFIILNSSLILLGVLILRYYIIYAGQSFT